MCDFMERSLANEISEKHAGKSVLISGWVSDIRDLGGLKFLILKDRSGTIQITMPKKEMTKEIMETAEQITKESVISVEGKAQSAKQAPRGIEIIPEKLELVSKAHAPIPLDLSGKIKSDLSVRLDYRFLDLRNPRSLAIFKIRSKMFKLITDYYDSQGFTAIQTPKITSAGVESGAELFPVVYFDKEAFLSQSPQVYKQMMVCAGFERVYEIAPVFRAEKSHTTRHLTEFTGVDFEMGFIKDENDVMDVIEGMCRRILEGLKKECSSELEMFGVNPSIPKKIPRIEMREIKKVLAEKYGKKIPEDEDLDAEGEEMAGKYVKEKYGEEFVFVTLYPWKKRPFYHMRPEGNANVTKSFDLIWNGVEIATGAQREHRYEILKAQAKEKGVDLDAMKSYADIFRYGAPPHGGVGLGLDRMVEQLLKLDNIREAILLPRDPERLTP